jgi:hypothetical protein
MRQQVTGAEVEKGVQALRDKIYMRLEQKGYGAHASCHEVLGIITEEYKEYIDAVHLNASDEEKIEELLDIAVACVFGAVSIATGKVDW